MRPPRQRICEAVILILAGIAVHHEVIFGKERYRVRHAQAEVRPVHSRSERRVSRFDGECLLAEEIHTTLHEMVTLGEERLNVNLAVPANWLQLSCHDWQLTTRS
jgi:hypothetical protein